jgi:O-antigen chain-terminating methyltransferase
MTHPDVDPSTSGDRIVPTEEAITYHLLSEIRRVARTPGVEEPGPPSMLRNDANQTAPSRDSPRSGDRLHELSELDHFAFVDRAYRVLLGREPTAAERWEATARLLRGEPKSAVLGALRFGPEGRARGVEVPGLGLRNLAQRSFRVPVLGYVLEWANALAKLPLGLRFGRATEQRLAAALAAVESRLAAEAQARTAQSRDEEAARSGLLQRVDAQQAAVSRVAERLEALASRLDDLRTESLAKVAAADAKADAHAHLLADIEGSLQSIRSRHDAIGVQLARLLPAHVPATLELRDEPLTHGRTRTAERTPTQKPSEAWYADFERVFYQSSVVAVKQRIYLPYIDRDLARRLPLLDLGCGRGEFMEILRAEGIRSVGVALGSSNVETLRASGHTVHAGDLIDFLERDRGTYAGAVALQVVEHLRPDALGRALALLQARLAPGAVLVIESVNPHCPYALGNFHMDPTHVAPVPPDRVRFAMEWAGFVRTSTLYQAPIPGFAFGGPEPRAHYTDYAVIGYRE